MKLIKGLVRRSNPSSGKHAQKQLEGCASAGRGVASSKDPGRNTNRRPGKVVSLIAGRAAF